MQFCEEVVGHAILTIYYSRINLGVAVNEYNKYKQADIESRNDIGLSPAMNLVNSVDN